MYREILVDHTSFHALQERGIDSRRISFATRQLLQLVENILLADTVWLTDTVTPGSMQVTAKTLEVFEKHGLNDARSEGKIRVARFTDSTLREVCERAAPRVFNIVQNIQGDDLLMPGSQLKYALQPAGAQSINYDRIRSLYLGSEEAEDYIGASIEARGWLPVSTLPLLHPDLWEWFQDLTASINDPSALRSFSTICRWQMNVEAARRLSVNASTIDYTPALGRSVTIEKVVRHSAASKLRSLESQINRTLWDMRNVGEHLKQMGPTIDFPIPLIGLWVILGLPERCTQDHLAERLVELQKHSWIRSLRDFIASADEDSIALVIKEVGDELRHSYLERPGGYRTDRGEDSHPLVFRGGQLEEGNRVFAPTTLNLSAPLVHASPSLYYVHGDRRVCRPGVASWSV